MEGDYRFGDYSFTPETGELISANSRVVLTKKDSEVLECLLRNTNDLVTKEIINKTVWANTVVSETVLRVCIKRLRKTLGDDCRSPSYIETIKGRGYRLLPPVQRLSLTSRQAPQLSNNAKHTDEAKKKPPEPFSSVSFVGRKYALEVLNKNMTEVLNGEARTVFVCGKAGMGKTELIKRFADSVTKNERVRILMGQGLKLAESREAYCPISSALYSFCKEIGDESFRELLYAYAPMWLQQFSWLTSTAERKELNAELLETPASHKTKELLVLLEHIANEKPLILVIEDLHWADNQTLAALTEVITSIDRANLFLIATYHDLDHLDARFSEAFSDLLVKQKCSKISLRPFSIKNIESYLKAVNCCNDNIEIISAWLYRNTKGLPLFVTNLYKYALLQGWFDQKGKEFERLYNNGYPQVVVPGTLRSLINSQINQLPLHLQKFIEIASVYGMMINTKYLARHPFGKKFDPEHCAEMLVKGFGFLKRADDVPMHHSRLKADFTFAHPWYQKVAYERLTPKQRADIHKFAGNLIEQSSHDNTDEIAAVLALHYEKAGNPEKAITYRKQAARVAFRKSTPNEVEYQLNRGINLLNELRDSQVRRKEEIEMLIPLGSILAARKGYAHPKVEAALSRAHQLCLEGESPGNQFPAIFDLCLYYITKGEFDSTKGLLETLVELTQSENSNHCLSRGYSLRCIVCFYQGKFSDSIHYAKRSIEYNNHHTPQDHCDVIGIDTGLASSIHHALALWITGYPDRAQSQMSQAIETAQDLENPLMKAWVFCYAGWLESFLRNYSSAENYGTFCLHQTQKIDMQCWANQASVLKDWAQVMSGNRTGNIDRLTKCIDAHQATGIKLSECKLLFFLAEALSNQGETEGALTHLDNALDTINRTGEAWWKAEILRLRTDLLVSLSTSIDNNYNCVFQEAEYKYHEAIDLAKQQSAKSLELRAAISLYKLLVKAGKREQGRNLLGNVYHSFNEGFKTNDLLKAQKLLMDNV